MRHLSIDAISIEGFRCFKERIDIEFPATGGLRYLTGRNLIEPSLGANGAGKSTVWDALCWCLYGVSVRGERAADLKTWHWNGRPNVIVSLYIDDQQHIIDRTGSPDTLLLDGVICQQNAVDNLLGMSRSRFLQSVLHGQACKLFLDMKVPERGELLDDMMNLGFWMQMAGFASKKYSALYGQEINLNSGLQYDKGQVEASLVQIDQLTPLETAWTKQLQTEIKEAQEQLRRASTAKDRLDTQIDALKQRVANLHIPDMQAELQTQSDTLGNIAAALNIATQRHDNLIAERSFLTEHASCPTCKQKIGAAFMKARTAELHTKIGNALQVVQARQTDHDFMRQQTHELRARLHAASENSLGILHQIAELEGDARGHWLNSEEAKRKLQRLRTTTDNPYTTSIRQIEATAEQIVSQITARETQLANLRTEMAKVHYWTQGFRRVRLFLINRILATLELEANAAASVLGIGDWTIKITADVDSKRPGIRIAATNAAGIGAYHSYSPGEAQRLKLAVDIGLSSLIQNMAGISYDLEVWDEPTEHLSNEGITDLIECLQHRADITGKMLWLVDHHTTDHPFDETWTVVKRATGSEVLIQ